MKKWLAACLMLCLIVPVSGHAEALVEDQPWLIPYEDTVVMHIANEEASVTNWELPGDSESENGFTRAYKDWLNIEVITDWISADYTSSLNLAIAANDLPDVFLVNNAQYMQLVEADLLEDMTDVYERSISDFAREQFDAVPSVLDAYKVDGRLYGIPRLYYGDIDKPYYMWLRKDWMEEMDAHAPASMEELITIVEQMNQTYGTKGMAVDKSMSGLLGIACAWNAYPGIWVTDEQTGEIAYGSIQPEMKEALASFADWYARGLINPDFATQDNDALLTDVINGKFGAQPFLQWWGWYGGSNIVNATGNSNAYFLPYTVPPVDAGPVLHPLVFPNDAVLVVRKGYEHPDAAVKLMNLHLYIDTEAVKDGLIEAEKFSHYTDTIQIMPFNVRPTMGDYNGYLQTLEYKKTHDESVFTYTGNLAKSKTAEAFLLEGDTTDLGGMLQMYHDQCAYSLAVSIVDNDEFKRDAMWGATPDIVNSYGSTLDDLLLEGFTLIITGQQPVDYFDTLAQTWLGVGGADMTAAVNDMYSK